MSTATGLPPLGSRSGANWGQQQDRSSYDSIYATNKKDPVETPPGNAPSFAFRSSASAGMDSSHPATPSSSATATTLGSHASPNMSTFKVPAMGSNGTRNGNRLFISPQQGPTPRNGHSNAFASSPGLNMPTHSSLGGSGSGGGSNTGGFGSSSSSSPFTPREHSMRGTGSDDISPNAMDPATASLLQPSQFGLRRRVGGASGGMREAHSGNSVSGSSGRMTRPAPPKVSRLGTSFDDHSSATMTSESGREYDSMMGRTDTSSSLQERTLVSKPTETTNQPPSSMTLAVSTSTTETIDPSTWVVVYGFTNSNQYKNAISKFDSFGTIKARFPSFLQDRHTNTNWVCLQYESALQANKALCLHGTLMDASGAKGSAHQLVMIGVQAMTLDLAWKLGLQHRNDMSSNPMENDSDASNDIDMESKSKDDEQRGPPTIMNEADVLLTKRDYSRDDLHRKFVTQHTSDSFGSEVGSGTICEKVLSWVFSWE